MTERFRFFPGERVLFVSGMPGPDTEPCEVLSDDGGETVRVRFQVYGRGKFYESDMPFEKMKWLRGSETSRRFQAWKAAQSGMRV